LLRHQELRFCPFTATASGALESKARKWKDTDCWVVVTHDCDLARVQATEPYLELMLCHKEDLDRARTAYKNSARRFLVDAERQLVALAPYRVCVLRSALADCAVEPWPGDAASLERFRAWLGWRYTRPAVPQDVHDAFEEPCVVALERLAEADGATLHLLSKWVEELRFVYFDAETPYEIQLLVLVKDGYPPQELEKGLSVLLDAWDAAIDPSDVLLARPPKNNSTWAWGPPPPPTPRHRPARNGGAPPPH
jgi:hypothetical protein